MKKLRNAIEYYKEDRSLIPRRGTPDHQAGNRETSQSFKDTVGRWGMSTLS
jgi:hypothetical protein